jgi:hypothetical protein
LGPCDAPISGDAGFLPHQLACVMNATPPQHFGHNRFDAGADIEHALQGRTAKLKLNLGSADPQQSPDRVHAAIAIKPSARLGKTTVFPSNLRRDGRATVNAKRLLAAAGERTNDLLSACDLDKIVGHVQHVIAVVRPDADEVATRDAFEHNDASRR